MCRNQNWHPLLVKLYNSAITLENSLFRSVYPRIYIYLVPFPHHCLPITKKVMAPHSSTLAWKIPRMEEPGRFQSMGSLRVEHD